MPPLNGPRAVVLYPIAGEHVDAGVAQPDRDLHLNFAVGGADYRAQVFGNAKPISSSVEIVRDRVEARDLRRPGMRCLVGNPRRLVRMSEPADGGVRREIRYVRHRRADVTRRPRRIFPAAWPVRAQMSAPHS